MKRLRVDETIKDGSGPPLTVSLYNHQTSTSINATGAAASTLVYPSGGVVSGVKVVSEGMQSGLYSPAPVSYGAMPTATVPHSGRTQQALSVGGGGHSQIRTTTTTAGGNGGGGGVGSPPSSLHQEMQQQPQQQQSPSSSNFQRLKVEDALSYLDLVKYKFGSKPQVYNDFLDIMKEFKSQSIDTPGVIQRVSNLFKGFPDLIAGFNTFLPPGYKIEVTRSDQGYAFQVSVSMPSPTGGNMTSDPQQQKSAMIMHGSGTINMSGSVPLVATTMAAAACQQQQQPLTMSQPQQQQHLSTSPVIAAAPPPPPQQQQQVAQPAVVVPVVHHQSNYGGGGVGGGVSTYNNALSAAQVAVSQALQGHTDTPQNQPVQFNHAINYVNKIKNRFQDQPEKYKRFLDILHIYQKEQRTLKESSSGGGASGKHLTEQEVYSQVAKLFENQSDLLAEFGQFLPDATSHINNNPTTPTSLLPDHHHSNVTKKQQQQPTNKPSSGGVVSAATTVPSYNRNSNDNNVLERHHITLSSSQQQQQQHHHHHHHNKSSSHNVSSSGQLKRSPPYPNLIHRDAPPPKKHKISTSSSSCRDVTLAEAGKFGSLNDYAFFDKVRKAVRTQEVYNNFLRCLTLFNQEIISKSELMMVVNPFLGKFPELMRWFREFLGQNDVESIPFNAATGPERPQGDLAHEIDLTTCKRLGASYCVIPKAQEGLSCSGRSQLCREVLNDQWVSFPTWSEDSTFVSSRKTQYEEYMYRCEDERFELDVVIETNASTIRILEGVNKKMNRMNPEDVARYRLDDCLGGKSPTLHQRALKRIYGDKAQDIIDGLKRNPAVAVPVVLRRLKNKEEEWREAQKGFNKIWREQNEKYYLKSLDHQGITFKQTDVKALRSKNLCSEIDTISDERNDQNEEGVVEAICGPHLILPYRDRTILDDAANLLIHHVKRQTGIQKGEKRRIKHLLRQFLPELFFHPKQQLTDDEREDEDEKDDEDSPNNNISPESSTNNPPTNSSSSSSSKTKGDASPTGNGKSPPGRSDSGGGESMEIKTDPDLKDEDDVKIPQHALASDPDEAYTLFMANHNWYVLLRLHAILCERLAKIYERAVILAADETKFRTNRKDSTAVALRLKPKPQIEIEDYYPAFLDMVKNLLDGNMDGQTYEDTLREMFGIHAYIAFTLDKVVSNAVRQLQHCVTERGALNCTELYLKEQKRNNNNNNNNGNNNNNNNNNASGGYGGTGGLCATANRRQHAEFAYQRAAEKLVIPDDNCYKIFIYKIDCRVTIELLDTESEDQKKVVEKKKNWSTYKERFTNCNRTSLLLSSSRDGDDDGDHHHHQQEHPRRRRGGGGDGVGGSNVGGGSGVSVGGKNKQRSPVYLSRNVRAYKQRVNNNNSGGGGGVGGSSSNSSGGGGGNSSRKNSNANITTTATTTTTNDSNNIKKTPRNSNQNPNNSEQTVVITTTGSAQNKNKRIKQRQQQQQQRRRRTQNKNNDDDENDADDDDEDDDDDDDDDIIDDDDIDDNDDDNDDEDDDDDEMTDNNHKKHQQNIVNNDDVDDKEKNYGLLDVIERKLNERGALPPERNQTNHPGYQVNDETECKFNVQDSKIMFTMNKDMYMYKISAFSKAKQSHPAVTKRLSSKFRAWLKQWSQTNISDVQHKQCTDWLMGRGDGVIPNRTRVLTDNDLTRTPYVPFNRYRVEKLTTNNDDST